MTSLNEKINNEIEAIEAGLKKKCSKCSLIKSRSEFYNSKNTKDGLHNQCKECVREYQSRSDFKEVQRKYRNSKKGKQSFRKAALKFKYNIEPRDLEDLHKKHDNKCAICRVSVRDIRHSSLCVDHDHNTGRIRGLLCEKCNFGIGYFQDDIELLQAAIEYLNRK